MNTAHPRHMTATNPVSSTNSCNDSRLNGKTDPAEVVVAVMGVFSRDSTEASSGTEDSNGGRESTVTTSDIQMKPVSNGVQERHEEFSVEQAIDQIGFGRFQLKISLLTAALSMTDAGELMLLSMLSPELQCEWHLEKWRQAFITTIVFVGYLIGSPLWGMFADKFGRRTALIMIGIWIFVFGLLSSFSPNYPWMLFLRGLVGFGIGGTAQTVVLYSEFLPSKVRGFWLCLVSFSWILGVVWVVAVAYFVMPAYGWRWLLIVAAMPLLIFIACCYIIEFNHIVMIGMGSISDEFLPESAYYHVACGNKEKALEVLEQVAKANKKAMPLGELKVGSRTDERGTFRDLYSDAKTTITTFLLKFIWFTMAFVYYGVVLLTTELFAKGHSCAATPADAAATCQESCVSLKRQDYFKIIITTLAEFPGHLITLGIIDYVGRKKTISVQNLFCAVSIFLLFICTNSQTVLTVFLFFARALISGAFQAIYVYTPEVYPTHVRGIGLGTCGSIARIGCIITPFVAQVLLGYYPPATIGLYGGICLAASLAIILLPIETKGRSLVSQVKETRATLKAS